MHYGRGSPDEWRPSWNSRSGSREQVTKPEGEGRLRNQASPRELVDDAIGENLGGLDAAGENELGILRRLIRLIDAGEVLHLAVERAALEALGVALDAGL